MPAVAELVARASLPSASGGGAPGSGGGYGPSGGASGYSSWGGGCELLEGTQSVVCMATGQPMPQPAQPRGPGGAGGSLGGAGAGERAAAEGAGVPDHASAGTVGRDGHGI